MRTSVSLYHRHRFPTEIISHCVWLYFRFAPELPRCRRDVMRGVSLSYETVREWCLKFGQLEFCDTAIPNVLKDLDSKHSVHESLFF